MPCKSILEKRHERLHDEMHNKTQKSTRSCTCILETNNYSMFTICKSTNFRRGSKKTCKSKSVSAPFSNVKAYVKRRNAVPVSRPTTPTLHAARSPRSQPSHFDKGPCSNAAFRTSKMGRKSQTAKFTLVLFWREWKHRGISLFQKIMVCAFAWCSHIKQTLFLSKRSIAPLMQILHVLWTSRWKSRLPCPRVGRAQMALEGSRSER